MNIERRDFLKLMGCGAAAAFIKPDVMKPSTSEPSAESMGTLFDSTECIGCRQCQIACHDLRSSVDPEAEVGITEENPKDLSGNTWTLVKLYRDETDKTTYSFVKVQCMHCVDPACASACPVGALEKTPGGPVVYHKELCIGCRYCMAACPFSIPKYQWSKVFPLVRKCDFCVDRQNAGQQPACAEACRIGALKYGKRSDLLTEARARIDSARDKYINYIYGENEVGGTSALYLSGISFDKLGFPALTTKPLPSLTKPWLSAVPGIIVGVGGLMSLLSWYNKRRALVKAEVKEEE
jgi:formate dehydrogenase iron-sulfur subunit